MLKCSWFLLRVQKLSNCNSNIHDLGAVYNEIFVYGLSICRQSCYKVGKIKTWGGNMVFPSTTSTTVGSQSHSQFTSPLCTPLSFSNLSNFINILEDFNLNQRLKFNSAVAIWPQPLITSNEEHKNSHAEPDKRST